MERAIPCELPFFYFRSAQFNSSKNITFVPNLQEIFKVVKRTFLYINLVVALFFVLPVLQAKQKTFTVVIDAGHGGADPGARGVVEEKNMTAATAAELIRLLQQDANFIPLQTRDSYDETSTPAQRAARASEQSPQLLLSIHGNSAANGSTASGFECYPSVPGRTWHQESFYFAQLLAEGMQASGAALRGHGGVRYIYYLENDQKQLVESTHTEVRAERSFTLLEDVNCPAVLAEQCFVTNEADVAQFGSEEGCKKTARVYYEAICAYFGTQPQAEQLAGFTLN